MNLEIAAVIAVVVIFALLLAKTVGFKLTKDGVSLSADKNKSKDLAAVEKNKKSKIDIETREGQDISVKENEDSDVKIK
ncbi:hypothetical protein [Methylovulum psychrotolerans]|uniref:Uncharacterized protein n=1 Tax=Methylovulum psychrotolerans TaxID=1704499 RepID=A0A2S5CSY4_9GAMM|nr:hypothetical protein [Methylovulum psychrotolerans]POZ53842.1 hypothetical protein AADEFJLK_00883 [Methylovulum psychrotolerans]